MSTYKWSVPTGKEINGQTYIKDTDNKIYDTIADLVDFVNGTGVHLNQGLAYDLVDRLSAQTISGVKTFSGGINSNVTGNLTGNVIGNTSGNAGTATKLQTSRNIELIGDITGIASFDGTANIQIDTTSTVIAIPSGIIVMWSGSVASIPAGWYLCDGTNSTPNLTDRFVIGAGNLYSVASTGGSKDAIVVSHTHTQASHTHNITVLSAGAHTHTVNAVGTGSYIGSVTGSDAAASSASSISTSSAGSHTHTATNDSATPVINSTGSSGTNANLPPYYALAYIMKG